jgi:ferritin
MLSQNMSDRLNKQINLEMYSSHLYLQMSFLVRLSIPRRL